MSKAKVSIDLFSTSAVYQITISPAAPSTETLTRAFEACILSMERLGKVADWIETIKVRFTDPEIPEPDFTVFLAIPDVPEKLEVKVNLSGFHFRSQTTADNALCIAEDLQKAINAQLEKLRKTVKAVADARDSISIAAA